LANVVVTPMTFEPVYSQSAEIVERKGTGHPDTICDSIAEELSVELCRLYLQEFGAVMHHNVDKALLVGGVAHPTFGGGEIISPIEIYLDQGKHTPSGSRQTHYCPAPNKTGKQRSGRSFHEVPAKG